MKAMKGYKPTHRSPAAIEAAVAEANARAEILANYSESELTAMGFDCSSYTDDEQRRAHFQNLRKEPIEMILRGELVPWDPVTKEEKPETPNLPVFGTVEDKVVDDFVLPVAVAHLGINGVAQHVQPQLQPPPAAGIIS